MNPKPPARFSRSTSVIRAIALLVGLCAFATTSLASWVLVEAVTAVIRAQTLRRDAVLANHVFVALQGLRIEGGTTVAVLSSGRGMAAWELDLQAREGRTADMALARATALAGPGALSARLREVQNDVKAMRAMAAGAQNIGPDAAIALTQTYMARFNHLIPDLEQATAAVSTRMRLGGDARVDDDVAIRELSWRARSYLGEFRAALGVYIGGGRPMTAEQHTMLGRSRAAGLALWAAAQDMLARPDIDPALTQAEKTAAESFTGPMAQWISHVFDAAPVGAVSAVPLKEYLGPAVEAGRVSQAITLAAAQAAVRHAAEDAHRAIRHAIAAALVLLVGIVLSATCLVILMQRLARPIRGLTAIVHRLSEGSEAPIATPRHLDELGRIRLGLIVLRQNAIAGRRSAEAELAAQHAAANHGRQLAQAGEVLDHDLQDLAVTLLQAQTRAGHAGNFANEAIATVRDQANAAAREADGVCKATRSIAAAAAQLSQSASAIGSQVTRAASMTGEAAIRVGEAGTTLDGLSEAAARIGGFGAMIQNVATRTNLLALNATIEAARAGHAGRGFSIVATEIKALARQTASATASIALQVADMQRVAQQSVRAIHDVSGFVQEVNTMATEIAAAIDQQDAATREIAASTAHAAGAGEAITGTVTAIRMQADRTGEASETAVCSTATVIQRTTELRTRMGEFLAMVRSGD